MLNHKRDQTGVIVFGGHVQGYGIVRIYGLNKIPSVVFDKSKYNIARHSKYCIDFYKVGYDDLIETLMKLGHQGKYRRWLLIPTDDYYVKLLSQNKKELNNFFTVSVDNWDKIQIFFNKKYSYPLVDELGIPVPKTYYPKSIADLKSNFSDIEFPCIIKPSIMFDFYRHFKKKVFVCNSFDELISNFRSATCILQPHDLMIQEIITGSSEHQFSVGAFFDRTKLYNFIVARRKRQHPIDFGNATTFAETVDIPILVEYAQKILTKADFSGLCEVEFKFDKRDNQYKFLEVNPRTWKWHLLSQNAKVPFLMSLYNFLLNNYPHITKSFRQGAWIDPTTDFPVKLIMLINGMGFQKNSNKKPIQAVFSSNDPLPFVEQLLYLPYNVLKR